MKKIRKAVIPVAGLGTRFLPITKSIPKEMLPIVKTPTLQLIIEEAVNSGIEEILLITNPYKKVIEDYFDQSFELEKRLEKSGKSSALTMVKNISKLCKMFYIRQGEPLGSGHAINLARSFIGDEPFAVLYGDDLMYSETKPVLKQLIDIYEKTSGSVIGCLDVDRNLVNRYGIIKLTNKGKIQTIIEKPKIEEAPTTLAGLGRYIVDSKIFDFLDNVNPGINGEYQFTDAMKEMMKSYDYYPCNIKGKYYDTGSYDGYFRANLEYGLRDDNNKDKIKDIIKENR